jgi:hypothetical protein
MPRVLKRFVCPKCGWKDKQQPLSKDKVQDIYLGLKEGISVSEIAVLIGRTKQLVYAIKHKKFKKEWTDEMDKRNETK